MSSRARRVLVPLLVIAAAVTLLAGPVLGQTELKGKSGELSDARCYGHHREEGFRSMDLAPMTVTQVAKGQPFQFELTIVNPWLHEIRDVYGLVNISGIPGAKFPGEQEPVTVSDAGKLAPRDLATTPLPTAPAAPASSKATRFAVEANATEVLAVLTGAPGALDKNLWQLTVRDPKGTAYATTVRAVEQDIDGGAVARAVVKLPYANVTEGGIGEWSAMSTFVRGTDPSADFTLDVTTYYNLSRSSELLVKGPETIAKRQSAKIAFEIIMPPEAVGQATLVYGGKGVAYHEHTDPNAEDEGEYLKYNSLTFSVGDATVAGQGGAIVILADPGPLMRSYGQILGFSATFLLLPALFLGGTFGTGSVRAFNKLLGGPRRRVLWHNSTSYLLLAVSLLHMFLFLLENFWAWEIGLVWGGLSLAAMIGLAVTGAFQKRFVAMWGFERWRFTHFSLGTIVVGFVLVHTLVDGSHFAPIREMLGSSPAAPP